MQSFAGGDIRDAGCVVPGASRQGSIVGGPLKIEYPIPVDVKVDSIWRWQLSWDNLAQVLTEFTNLAPLLLALRYPKCTLCPVRSQRPDEERRHVSQLTTTISFCGSYAHIPKSETYN